MLTAEEAKKLVFVHALIRLDMSFANNMQIPQYAPMVKKMEK